MLLPNFNSNSPPRVSFQPLLLSAILSHRYHCAEHKHSDYEFEWHCKVRKEKEGRAKDEDRQEEDFVTDKPWKAARAIIGRGSAGSNRLRYILSLDGKPLSAADGAKY